MSSVIVREKILILGLGGAGGRVVQALSAMPDGAGLMLAVFDTDRTALDNLTALPENCKVLCDEQWLSGQGTGGYHHSRENHALRDAQDSERGYGML